MKHIRLLHNLQSSKYYRILNINYRGKYLVFYTKKLANYFNNIRNSLLGTSSINGVPGRVAPCKPDTNPLLFINFREALQYYSLNFKHSKIFSQEEFDKLIQNEITIHTTIEKSKNR